MKKWIFSNGASEPVMSLALLGLRVSVGLFMLLGHGWNKFESFDKMKETFPVSQFPLFSWMNNATSLGAAIFGEVVCSALLILGLATRPAAAFFAITMAVAAFEIHADAPLFMAGGAAKEPALLYMIPALFLLLTGAGKFSCDAKLSVEKKRMFR